LHLVGCLYDNMTLDLTETGWEGVDCIHFPECRGKYQAALNTLMGLRLQFINFLSLYMFHPCRTNTCRLKLV